MQYYGDVYRPPSEAYSFIIQITLGCSNNTCAFCDMYKKAGFKIRTLEDIKADLLEVSSAYSHRIKRIFLADGDALIRKTEDLVTILDWIFELFPKCERVSSYASPISLKIKTPEELELLRKHGLSLLYIGLESGSDTVLKLMQKNADFDEIVGGAKKAKAAGMGVSVTAIAGLGGKKYSDEHALMTAKALSEMNPEYIGLLTLGIHPGTPLEAWVKDGSFELLNPIEILNETRVIVQNIDSPGSVFRMNHASNYVPLRGTFNEEKNIILSQIDEALKGQRAMRPEWARSF